MERKPSGKKPSFPDEPGSVNLVTEISDEEFDTVEDAAQQPLRVTYKHPSFKEKPSTKAPRKSSERLSSTGGITSFILPPPDAYVWGKIKTEQEELKVKFMAVGDTHLSRIEGWYGLEPITDIRQDSEDFGIDFSDMAYAMKLCPLGGREHQDFDIIITRRVKRPNDDLPRTGTMHLSYPFIEQSVRDSKEVSSALHEIRRRTLSNKSFTKRTSNKGKIGQDGTKASEEDEISSIAMDERPSRQLSSGLHSSVSTGEKGFVNDDWKCVKKSLSNKRKAKMDRGDMKHSNLNESAVGDLNAVNQVGFYGLELLFTQRNMNFYCYPVFSTSRSKSLKNSLSKTRNNFSVTGGVNTSYPENLAIEKKRESDISGVHNPRKKNKLKCSHILPEKKVEVKKGLIQTTEKTDKIISDNNKWDTISSKNETSSSNSDFKINKEVPCQISDSKKKFCVGNDINKIKTISKTLKDSLYSYYSPFRYRPTKNSEEVIGKAKKTVRVSKEEFSFGLRSIETRKNMNFAHKTRSTYPSLKTDNRFPNRASKSKPDPRHENKDINVADHRTQYSYQSTKFHQNSPKSLIEYQGSKLRTQSKINCNKTIYPPDNSSIHQPSNKRLAKLRYKSNQSEGNKEIASKTEELKKESHDNFHRDLRNTKITREINIANKSQVSKKSFKIDSESSYRAKKLRKFSNKDISDKAEITNNISKVNSSNQRPLFNYIYAAREESQRKYAKRKNISFKLSLNEDVANNPLAGNTENNLNYCSKKENKRPYTAQENTRESQKSRNKDKTNTANTKVDITSNKNTSFYEFPKNKNTNNAANLEKIYHESELYDDTINNITGNVIVHINKKQPNTSSSENDEENQYRFDKSRTVNQKDPYLKDIQEDNCVSQDPSQKSAYQNMKLTETSYVDPDLKLSFSNKSSKIDEAIPRGSIESCCVSSYGKNDCYHCNNYLHDDLRDSKTGNDIICSARDEAIQPSLEIYQETPHHIIKSNLASYVNLNSSEVQRLGNHYFPKKIPRNQPSIINDEVPSNYEKFPRVPHYANNLYCNLKAVNSVKDKNFSTSHKNDTIELQVTPNNLRKSRIVSHEVKDLKEILKISILANTSLTNLCLPEPSIENQEVAYNDTIVQGGSDYYSNSDNTQTNNTTKHSNTATTEQIAHLLSKINSFSPHQTKTSKEGYVDANVNQIQKSRSTSGIDLSKNNLSTHKPSISHEVIPINITKLSKISHSDRNLYNNIKSTNAGTDKSFSKEIQYNHLSYFINQESSHKIRNSTAQSYVNPPQKIINNANVDTYREILYIPLPSKYDDDVLIQLKKLSRVFNNNNNNNNNSINRISYDDKRTSNNEKVIQLPSEYDHKKQTQIRKSKKMSYVNFNSKEISNSGGILVIDEEIPNMSTDLNRESYHENERDINEPFVVEVNSNNTTKLSGVFQYFGNVNDLLMTICKERDNNLTLGQPDNLSWKVIKELENEAAESKILKHKNNYSIENSLTNNSEINVDSKMNKYNYSAFINNEGFPHQSSSFRKRSYLHSNSNELRNLSAPRNRKFSNITVVHYFSILLEYNEAAKDVVDSTISSSSKMLNILKNNPRLCEILSNYAKADRKNNYYFDRILEPLPFENFYRKSNKTSDIEDENKQMKYSPAEMKRPTKFVTGKVFKNSSKKSPVKSEDVYRKSQKLDDNSLNLDKNQNEAFRKSKSSYPESPTRKCQCREKEEFHNQLEEKEGTVTEYELTIELWKFVTNCFANCKTNPIIRFQRKKGNLKK